MYKLIIYDVDGVLNKLKMFSVQYQKLTGVTNDAMLPFFKGEFKDCILGKADLKEKVAPWLEKWQWRGDVNSFLEFWFQSENNVDVEIIKSVVLLQQKGYKTVVATNQEKYRTEYVSKIMKLDKIFENIYASCDVGMKKKDPRFFEQILNDYGAKPEEVLFFDDDNENIEAAESLGIDAVLVKNNNDYFSKVNAL